MNKIKISILLILTIISVSCNQDISENNRVLEVVKEENAHPFDYNSIAAANDSVVANVDTKYTVTLSRDEPLLVNVKAEFSGNTSQLSMSNSGAGQRLTKPWSIFIDNFLVLNKEGDTIAFSQSEDGNWKLKNPITGPITVFYTINFDFATKPWPAGNEHGAYYEDGALYSVSKALFVLPDAMRAAEIAFQIPSSGLVTTPLLRHPNKEFTYIAKNRSELLQGFIVMGDQAATIYTDGDYNYILSLIGEIRDQEEIVLNGMQKIQTRLRTWFPPPSLNFLQVLFKAPNEDGEFFGSASANTTSLIPDKNNAILWAKTLAHETLHTWHAGPSPHSLSGDSFGTSQWTSEGFTEYIAALAVVRENLISRNDFIAVLENHMGAYLYYQNAPAFESSLLEAGSRKSYNRHAVYSGGFTVAFCLDIMIRESTEGKKSFDDFMRTFYQQFAGKRYNYNDVVSIASDVASKDLSDFFDRHVKDKERIPIEKYLKKAGLKYGIKEYAGFVYIWETENATKRKNLIIDKIINGN
jgi:predicted metalloprotease with PDZ domain